jgi:hypothetical protein
MHGIVQSQIELQRAWKKMKQDTPSPDEVAVTKLRHYVAGGWKAGYIKQPQGRICSSRFQLKPKHARHFKIALSSDRSYKVYVEFGKEGRKERFERVDGKTEVESYSFQAVDQKQKQTPPMELLHPSLSEVLQRRKSREKQNIVATKGRRYDDEVCQDFHVSRLSSKFSGGCGSSQCQNNPGDFWWNYDEYHTDTIQNSCHIGFH